MEREMNAGRVWGLATGFYMGLGRIDFAHEVFLWHPKYSRVSIFRKAFRCVLGFNRCYRSFWASFQNLEEFY